MENYKVRKATLKDAEIIWKIRNHPEIRLKSGNQNKISLKEHKLWFENKYFKESYNYCFVIELDKLVIGYCRLDFDRDENCYNVSIAIKYGYQARGYGNVLLDRTLKKIKIEQGVIAKVKKDNKHSLGLFQKNNFIIDRGDDEYFYLKFSGR